MIGQVSIHAPARGATEGEVKEYDLCKGFNPRPRAGGDAVRYARRRVLKRFNPRPRAGGDFDI